MTQKKPARVLVIDDEEAIRSSYRDYLEDCAFRVFEAANGLDGLEVFEQERVDLILLDLRMPGMDGLEVLARVRERSPETPTIVVSGTGHAADVIQALRLGASDYLLKPIVDLEALRRAIHTGLTRSRELKESRAYQGHLEAEISRRTEQIERATEALQEAHDMLETRVAQRTEELVEANDLLRKEVAERQRVEEALRESEHRMRSIFECVQAGIVLIDASTHRVVDANPVALSLVGAVREQLVGHECHRYICPAPKGQCPVTDLGQPSDTCESVLITLDGRRIPIQKTVIPIMLSGHPHLLESFVDVSNLRNMLDRQDIDIGLSKDLLDLVDTVPPRTQDISDHHALVVEAIRLPCAAEGGDHYFVRAIGEPPFKTVISLKDETGHEVRCILRSIITDLLHNTILRRTPHIPLAEAMGRLNRELRTSALMGVENFLTSLTASIDHASLELQYVSAGHPPFLFIRDGEVTALPEPGAPGANLALGLLPDAVFTAGTLSLRTGDKIIAYTDGLTEMPIHNGGRLVTTEQLVRLMKEKMDLSLPITDLVHGLLDQVANLSGIDMAPFCENSSDDDITLLGFELEDTSQFEEVQLESDGRAAFTQKAAELGARLSTSWKQHGFVDPQSRLAPLLMEAARSASQAGVGADSVVVRWRFGNDFHLEVGSKARGAAAEAGTDIQLVRACADEACWRDDGQRLAVSFRRFPDPVERKRRVRAKSRMDLWK